MIFKTQTAMQAHNQENPILFQKIEMQTNKQTSPLYQDNVKDILF